MKYCKKCSRIMEDGLDFTVCPYCGNNLKDEFPTELVLETPNLKNPAPEYPVTETPAFETSVIEPSVIETPVLGAPIIENPIIENPIIETPSVDVAVPAAKEDYTPSLGDFTLQMPDPGVITKKPLTPLAENTELAKSDLSKRLEELNKHIESSKAAKASEVSVPYAPSRTNAAYSPIMPPATPVPSPVYTPYQPYIQNPPPVGISSLPVGAPVAPVMPASPAPKNDDHSMGYKIGYFILAVVVPVIGFIVGISMMNGREQSKKSIGHSVLIVSLIQILFWLLICCCVAIIAATAGEQIIEEIYYSF